MKIRTLAVDRVGRVLLRGQDGSWAAFIGEQRSEETPESAVMRIVRESAGIELPFFTKLLEHDDEAWFLVALDNWPPARHDLRLIDGREALHENLEGSTRYVLEWFNSPTDAYVHPPGREAAEA